MKEENTNWKLSYSQKKLSCPQLFLKRNSTNLKPQGGKIKSGELYADLLRNDCRGCEKKKKINVKAFKMHMGGTGKRRSQN